MHGGARTGIDERFVDITERAARVDLSGWAQTPRGRLELVLVLDQFSRSAFRERLKGSGVYAFYTS